MSSQKPKRWQLYLTLPSMVALFWLAHRAGLSGWQEKTAQVGIVLLTLGLMAMWVSANSIAIVQEQVDEQPEKREPVRESITERRCMSTPPRATRNISA